MAACLRGEATHRANGVAGEKTTGLAAPDLDGGDSDESPVEQHALQLPDVAIAAWTIAPLTGLVGRYDHDAAKRELPGERLDHALQRASRQQQNLIARSALRNHARPSGEAVERVCPASVTAPTWHSNRHRCGDEAGFAVGAEPIEHDVNADSGWC